MDVVEFLRARLHEDESMATEARAHEHLSTRDSGALAWRMEDGLSHMCVTSGRVLREVEAKRQIVNVSSYYLDFGEGEVKVLAQQALESLAAVYEDHADYRVDWTT
jgi:hypothetical protein